MKTANIYDQDHKIVAENKQLVYAPLWWHTQGLQQTASGYGKKLTTRYKVNFEGKLRRVYVTQYSNAGTAWFKVKDKKFFVQ